MSCRTKCIIVPSAGVRERFVWALRRRLQPHTGLTVKQLAGRAGIGERTLRSHLAGYMPSLDVIDAYTRALGDEFGVEVLGMTRVVSLDQAREAAEALINAGERARTALGLSRKLG